MRKNYFLLVLSLLLFVSSCSVNDEIVEHTPKDVVEGDTLKFNRNGPIGGFSELFPIGGYESNNFYKIHVDDRVNINGDLLYRVEDGKPQIINDDVSMLCNINQYSNCSGFIGMDSVSYFYNDKFYIMTTQIEGVSDKRETIIYEANSNIGDQREIYRFNTQVVVNEHRIPTT